MNRQKKLMNKIQPSECRRSLSLHEAVTPPEIPESPPKSHAAIQFRLYVAIIRCIFFVQKIYAFDAPRSDAAEHRYGSLVTTSDYKGKPLTKQSRITLTILRIQRNIEPMTILSNSARAW